MTLLFITQNHSLQKIDVPHRQFLDFTLHHLWVDLMQLVYLPLVTILQDLKSILPVVVLDQSHEVLLKSG